MKVYYIFLFILCLLTFFSADKRLYKISTLLVFIIYILFVGFRFETGFDWVTYRNEFETINFNNPFWEEVFTQSKNHKHELFYVIVVYYIKYFLSSFFFITFLSSYFVYYSYKKLCAEYKLNINVFVLIVIPFLLFSIHFSVIRQSIALGLFNLAIISHNHKRYKKLVFLLLLGTLFHISTIVYIVIYFFSKYLASKKDARLALLIYISVPIFGFVLPKILSKMSSSRIVDKLRFYLNYDFKNVSIEVLFTFILYVGILLFVFSLKKRDKIENKWMSHYIALSIVISFAFFFIKPIRNRIFYELLVLTAVYFLIHKKSLFTIKDFKLLFLHIFGFIFFTASLVKFYSIGYVPYHSYFYVWLFDDKGNGEARQDYIYFKAYREEIYKRQAIKKGKLEEYYEMVKKLEKDANIKPKK